MNIERTLRKRREELNMSQRQIAELLNVSESAYQKWEKGKNEPPPSTLEMIAGKLDIPIQDFFGNGAEGEKRYER